MEICKRSVPCKRLCQNWMTPGRPISGSGKEINNDVTDQSSIMSDEDDVENCFAVIIAVTAWKEQVPEDSVHSP